MPKQPMRGWGRTELRFEGEKQLQAKLSTLSDQMQRKVARAVVRAQGLVLKKAIKRRAPTRKRKESYIAKTKKGFMGMAWRRRSVGLRSSISMRNWSVPKKGIIAQIVGPRWPDGAHGHLVEFGHEMVTRSGRKVGHVRAHPFMRPAIAASKSLMRSKGIGEAKRQMRKIVHKLSVGAQLRMAAAPLFKR